MANYPNPTTSKVAGNPSKVDRRVMCAGYESCLDEAVRRKWRGFSCRRCRAFKPVRLDLSEWLEDSLACIALISVAEYPSSFKHKSRGRIILKMERIQSRGDVLGLSRHLVCEIPSPSQADIHADRIHPGLVNP